MKKTLLIAGCSLVTIFGLLQFLLLAQVVSVSAPVTIMFGLAGVGILLGLFLRRPLFLGIGLLLAILAPLTVGIKGIEQFEVIHHVVRLVFVAAMVALLFFGGWQRRRAAQANSTDQA